MPRSFAATTTITTTITTTTTTTTTTTITTAAASPAPHLRREGVLGVAVGGVKVQRVAAPPGRQVGAGQHGRVEAEVPRVDVGAVGGLRAGRAACRTRPGRGGGGRQRHPEQQLHGPGTVVGVHQDHLSACGVRSRWLGRLVFWAVGGVDTGCRAQARYRYRVGAWRGKGTASCSL